MFKMNNAVQTHVFKGTDLTNNKDNKTLDVNAYNLPQPLKNTRTSEVERLKTKGVNVREIEGMKTKEQINLSTYVNCLKHMSPILQKVSELDEELQSEYIYSHTLNANNFALKVMEGLGVMPLQQKWMVNALERIYSENFIKNNKATDIDFKVSVDNLVKYVKQTINEGKFIDPVYDNDLSSIKDSEEGYTNLSLKIQLAYTSMLSEALSCYQAFNFYIKEEYFLNEYFEFLKNETKKWFETKVKDNSLLSSGEKAIFYISLLKEVNVAFIEIWKKEARAFILKFRNFNEQDKQQWFKENPMGYNIHDLFNTTHARLQQLFNLVGIVQPLRNKF